MDFQDTICAIATAQGGAIGLIRVSGPSSIRIVESIFKSKRKSCPSLSDLKAYSIDFGVIEDEKGNVVDEVLVSLFRAPHSYTGEDSVEISCHGSSYVLQEVLRLLIINGCRMAEPGEYTKRAFLNGKMDLSQAEAVADLIASTSEKGHDLAIRQMRGGISNELNDLRLQLLHITSMLELELDFSDHEELEFADRTEIDKLASQIETHISKLADSFRLGNAIKNGIPVAIVGETNVGKSTLLNALLDDDRAIVSNICGTTRDVIEGVSVISGVTFRFIDTAGIRDTDDEIENIGIEKAFLKVTQADIILWVIDVTDALNQFSELSSRILPCVTGEKRLILVFNKKDLICNDVVLNDITKNIISQCPKGTSFYIVSSHDAEDILRLRTVLSDMFPSDLGNNIVVSNARHYEALNLSLAAIRRVKDGLKENISSDLVSQDLRDCLFHLAEITGGEITTNEVLENIFKNFCVGK